MTKNFSNIQAGDKLLKKSRTIKSGIHRMTEWGEVTVESVTKVFYVVNGEKYRKENNGKEFMNNFCFPGQNDAPDNATPQGQFDTFCKKLKQLEGLDLVRTNIETIQNLDKAVEIAEKLKHILKEIEEARR